MKNCKNNEHKKPCEKKARCWYCGKITCSANYADHICPAMPKIQIAPKVLHYLMVAAAIWLIYFLVTR